MDWTRFEVDGRVTAIRSGAYGGVGSDGSAFVGSLGLPSRDPQVIGAVLVDSFGVVAVSFGDAATFSGRGGDGRLHVWLTYDHPDAPIEDIPLEASGAVWAAPVVDGRADLLLTAHVSDGSWRLRTHLGGQAFWERPDRANELSLGGEPDSHLSFAFYEKGPLVVAGSLGDGSSTPASAWVLPNIDGGPMSPGDDEWRRVHLLPAPTELTSAAVSLAGTREWVAGRVDDRPVAYEVLRLPFRGLVRSSPVTMPRLELAQDARGPAGGRAVVLVDGMGAELPVFVAATTRGNRLCWHDGSEWKALPAPEGRLQAACTGANSDGIHLLVGGAVWSIEDPTGG